MRQSVDCTTVRGMLPDLVATGAAPAGAIAQHLSMCPACGPEHRELRAAWDRLPGMAGVQPPPATRHRILRYARAPVRASGVVAQLWTALNDLAPPLAVGVAGTLATVLLLRARGAMAELSGTAVLAVGLMMSAALTLVAGALLRSAAPRAVRAVLVGAVGALGAHVAVSVALPLGAAFEVCRFAVFGDAALSLGQVCGVYLVVAALYAGVPLTITTYWWSNEGATWRTGLGEAVVFVVLATPVLLLQAGLAELMITGTVMLGLAGGAVLGGLGGVWAKHRLAPRPTG